MLGNFPFEDLASALSFLVSSICTSSTFEDENEEGIWKEISIFKNTWLFQYTRKLATIYNYNSRGSDADILFWPQSYYICSAHRHIHSQNTHTHKVKMNIYSFLGGKTASVEMLKKHKLTHNMLFPVLPGLIEIKVFMHRYAGVGNT